MNDFPHRRPRARASRGSPPQEFEARALFQMRFYALTLWRAKGQVPKLLQLIYLGNGEIVRYEPD